MTELLFSESEFRERLKSYAAGRKWWFVVPCGQFGLELMLALEMKFFPLGAANADFELCIVDPSFSIGLAKKSRLSPKQMADFINEVAEIEVPAEILFDKDVLFLGESEDFEAAMKLRKRLLDLVGEIPLVM